MCVWWFQPSHFGWSLLKQAQECLPECAPSAGRVRVGAGPRFIQASDQLGGGVLACQSCSSTLIVTGLVEGVFIRSPWINRFERASFWNQHQSFRLTPTGQCPFRCYSWHHRSLWFCGCYSTVLCRKQGADTSTLVFVPFALHCQAGCCCVKTLLLKPNLDNLQPWFDKIGLRMCGWDRGSVLRSMHLGCRAPSKYGCEMLASWIWASARGTERWAAESHALALR